MFQNAFKLLNWFKNPIVNQVFQTMISNVCSKPFSKSLTLTASRLSNHSTYVSCQKKQSNLVIRSSEQWTTKILYTLKKTNKYFSACSTRRILLLLIKQDKKNNLAKSIKSLRLLNFAFSRNLL